MQQQGNPPGKLKMVIFPFHGYFRFRYSLVLVLLSCIIEQVCLCGIRAEGSSKQCTVSGWNIFYVTDTQGSHVIMVYGDIISLTGCVFRLLSTAM